MHLIRNLLGSTVVAASSYTAVAGTDTIRNFHQVSPAIFRSAHLETTDFAKLREAGIKNVLSLEDYQGDSSVAAAEQGVAAAAGLDFSWLPMDGFAKPALDQVERALAYIIDPAHQPVVVHCYYGSDRTGIVIAAYRIKVEHWPIDQARQEMYQYGHSPLLAWWDDLLQEI